MQLLWVSVGLPVALLSPLPPSCLPFRTLWGDGCRMVSLCDCALLVWGRGAREYAESGAVYQAISSAGCRGYDC